MVIGGLIIYQPRAMFNPPNPTGITFTSSDPVTGTASDHLTGNGKPNKTAFFQNFSDRQLDECMSENPFSTLSEAGEISTIEPDCNRPSIDQHKKN